MCVSVSLFLNQSSFQKHPHLASLTSIKIFVGFFSLSLSSVCLHSI